MDHHLENRTHPKNKYLKILIGAVVSFFFFLISLLIVYKPSGVSLVFFDPSVTPTYFTATPQATLTPRPTSFPTVTPTLAPTMTPFPQSVYLVQDFSALRPALNIKGESAIVLNEDIAIVDPPLDNFQWISSDTIAQDIGYEITEPYFATFSGGSINWFTDLPIKPALYEIFVMDTLFSSGGELDFTVRLNDLVIEPVIGESFLEYQSSQGEPPQYNDLWQSIGIYDITQMGILSVFTEWGSRDDRSIVAVDRVIILEHSPNARNMVQQLPISGEKVFLIDDENAEFSTEQYWDYWEDPSAWGKQYQIISEPPLASSVTWKVPNKVSYGQYEVLVWVPAVSATAPVTYQFFAAGIQIARDDGISDVIFEKGLGEFTEAQWVSLGTWTIPEHYADNISISLVLSVAPETSGEAVVDAVAFIKK